MALTNTKRKPTFSFTCEFPPAEPADAARHFAARLAYETDPSEVEADLDRGMPIVVVDARPARYYDECHIKGAINMPHRSINADSTAAYSRDTVFITYCTGVGCNASTKAALRLANLGFRVKEMTGGIVWWRSEGFAVEGTLGNDAPMYEGKLHT